jgi:ribonucleoside-diphosphate reductase beta chain
VTKDDSDFVQLEKECAEEVYALYMDVIREEKEWAEYLFKLGPVIGLNATILSDFVDYTAFTRLKEIGIKYQGEHPKFSPIPWFNKHVNINKKQTALQENESTNYVVGVMSSVVEHEELPDL